jgi:putative nucleotidyltransferase with HDIG domain
VLAHWLCEHLDGNTRHIAIDDLHDASGNVRIASFIAKFAELRPKAPLTIAVRSVGELPIALWMATGRMERPINEGDLRFTHHEVATGADRLGVELNAAMVEQLVAATNGLPIAVTYALTRLRYNPNGNRSTLLPPSFRAIAAEIFGRRSDRERDFLFNAVLLPSIEDDALRLSGWDDPADIRSAMGGDASFMWEGDAETGVRFHDRFRDYLLERFESHGALSRCAIVSRTMQSLLRAGRYASALELATGQRLLDAIAELLDTHGFKILESGAIGVISEALDVLTRSEQSLGATALALRGYIDARLGRLDTAEAWFRLGLDKAEDESSRVAIAMYYARELSLQRREDACDVLAAFVGSTTLAPHVLVDVRSSFAQALLMAGRHQEACSHADEALALLDHHSPRAQRARVFGRGAYVALESGKLALARERALIAIPLALAEALYETAASSHSVLYNVAYDIEDDAVASLENLRRMRDLGIKSGTLKTELYVMCGMYELYVEAGDEAGLREIDARLRAIDKHDAVLLVTEGVTPAKALQAAWSGHFDDAQRLIASTPERQRTPLRGALRWAKIGLFCAAAGHAERSQAAARSAELELQRSDSTERVTTQYGLTLLILALTAYVSGEIDLAGSWMRTIDEAAIANAPRLRALQSAVAALIAGMDDANRFAQDVPAALAALRGVSFGGMAKLIEALPYRSGDRGEAAATIGNRLAHAELSARFESAVTAGDAGPLRTWLDTLPGSTFGKTSLLESFDRWAAEQVRLEAGSHGDLRRVRRQLDAYRRATPAIVRVVDDVDVLVEKLFADLDVASTLMAEHSRAVSAWCSRLARTLGLSEIEIAFVTRCGLIHDIGKMRTPAEILNAPRQLTPAEWAVMRAHTVEGERILASVSVLQPFAPIVRGHHERLDGKGYPDGLRANAIPLAARIVTVADCFNAMIGRRPYRPPMLPTEALDELERHRHTQFDPEIVEAMVQVVLGRFAEPALSERSV